MLMIDHDNLDRIENTLIVNRAQFEAYTQWWLRLMRHLKCRESMSQFFRRVLGKQDHTETFVHRNRIWYRPAVGWTLYVDKRGPALHCVRGATYQQAVDAFERFRTQVETALGCAL